MRTTLTRRDVLKTAGGAGLAAGASGHWPVQVVVSASAAREACPGACEAGVCAGE